MREAERKVRVMSLRLSEMEYQAMRKLYRSVGASSISDFARLAMKRTIKQSDAEESELLGKLREMEGRINAIEGRLSVILEKGAAV